MHRAKWLGPTCAALFWLLAVACDESGESPAPTTDPLRAYCGESYATVEQRIDELLGQMTLEEKVAQMHGAQALPTDGPWITPDNERLGIPGFAMIDGPRGVSIIAGNATAFPVGMARGATWDPFLEERVGEAMGIEARARGANVLLAPTINVLRHPRWGRAQETYGEDPLHIGRMGVAFIAGAQRHVIASAKHYAANSIEDTRFDVNVTVDERTLREIYLPHFRMAVQEGHVGSVMSAYNRVNGVYCAENAHLLRDILKGEWGFLGFVESDWYLGARSTVPSALAGLDIEMPGPSFYGPRLVSAVASGELDEAVIDDAVRRILRAKLCYQLDTDPPVLDPARIETPEHTALALEVARRGIVLLKNEGPVLPIDRAAADTLVVLGPLADVENIGDTGSSDVSSSYVVTVVDGLLDRAGSVTVTHIDADPLLEAHRSAIAGAGAVVVVVGFTSDDEGEGLVGAGDRESLALPDEQVQLILEVAGLNDSVVVVLEGGAAITMAGWVEAVEGILMAWYPGMEGGNAIADVLFGEKNPSGRLPISFPVVEADLPDFDNESLEVVYGYYHGYRHLDGEAVAPLFPFGFGLGFTTFDYANLALSDTTLGPSGTLRVSVDVTNTGDVAGFETVQLYVGAQGSSVDRPVRELEAFTQVELAPGETRTVTLDVRAQDLAYYDNAAAAWTIEPISYEVRVGSSSRDLPLGASFSIAGR